MSRRGRREVRQRALEDTAVTAFQRRSSPAPRNGHERGKEPLNPAMTIAQEPERLVEAVIGWLSNLHEH
jgi:hypothetical protein